MRVLMSMKFLCLMLLSFHSSMVFSQKYPEDLTKLVTEFLEQNSSVIENKNQERLIALNEDLYEAALDLFLSAEASRFNNDLENFSSVFSTANNNVEEKVGKSYSLDLTKKFSYGTTLLLENVYTDTEFPKVATTAGQSFGEFFQKLTLTQSLGKDFFGRDFIAGLDTLKLTTKTVERQVDKDIEELLLNFFNSVLDVKFKMTILEIERKALERAQKRQNLISRKVQDGLKEKVDLYQAKIAVTGVLESIKIAENELESAKESVGSFLHRNIDSNEMTAFQLPLKAQKVNIVEKKDYLQNKNMNLLQGQYELLKKEKEKIQMAYFPQVSLFGSYKTSSVNTNGFTASYNEGKLGKKNDEWIIGVTVSTPLGFIETRTSAAQKNIELETNKMRSRKLLQNLKIIDQSLLKQIKRLRETIDYSLERNELANLSLKEVNRLYFLGRTDLDRVISAEEELLQTQKSIYNYQVALQKILGAKAQLYGELYNYIISL